jgi:hypothetical protein
MHTKFTCAVGYCAWPRYCHSVSDEPGMRKDESTAFWIRHTSRLSVGMCSALSPRGMTEAKIFADFPQLSHDVVVACLAFAKDCDRFAFASIWFVRNWPLCVSQRFDFQ